MLIQPSVPLTICSGILAALSTIWLSQALVDHNANRLAIVTTPASAVRFGPLEESQISFNVRDGNELRYLAQKDGWLQVADPSNRTGWIPTNDVVRLR